MSQKDRIKGYRYMLGFTQKQMSEELGISKQSYHNKENGIVSFKDTEKVKFKMLVNQFNPELTIDDIFFTN